MDAALPMPRCGEKAKRRRLVPSDLPIDGDPFPSCGFLDDDPEACAEYSSPSFGFDGRPSTEFLGWRRLMPPDILRLEPGSSVIIVLPSNTRSENKTIRVRRDAFRSRLIQTIRAACRDELPPTQNPSQRRRDAMNLLEDRNGVQRNGGAYIELPAVIKAYPRRSELVLDALLPRDVRDHVLQDGGMELRFVDYPHNNSTLLKLEEITSVQFLVPHRRGDARPQVHLSERQKDMHYWHELPSRLEEVKDDLVQMLELRLAFEKRKTRILQKQLKKVATYLEENEACMKSYGAADFKDAMKSEIADRRLHNFAHETDRVYSEVVKSHYSAT